MANGSGRIFVQTDFEFEPHGRLVVHPELTVPRANGTHSTLYPIVSRLGFEPSVRHTAHGNV
jgi:hypothetical protein